MQIHHKYINVSEFQILIIIRFQINLSFQDLLSI